jgi:hypothetical protein
MTVTIKSVEALLKACGAAEPANLFIPWNGKRVHSDTFCGYEFPHGPDTVLRVTNKITETMSVMGSVSLKLSNQWTVAIHNDREYQHLLVEDAGVSDAAREIFEALQPKPVEEEKVREEDLTKVDYRAENWSDALVEPLLSEHKLEEPLPKLERIAVTQPKGPPAAVARASAACAKYFR